MKGIWNYSKIIDLEYFIAKDSTVSEAELRKRDREFFLKFDGDDPLWGWLVARTRDYDGPPLPGAVARDAFALVTVSVLVAAFLSGVLSATFFCSYSGDTPINVLPFLAIFVASQLFFVALVSLRHLFDWRTARAAATSPLVLLLVAWVKKMSFSLLKRAGQSLSAEQSLGLQAVWGKMRQRETTYGRLFYWPIFLLLQRAGIVFNIGLLLAFFVKIGVSDLAFGWQSTLQFSAQSLYELVRVLALPWSWLFGEGVGFPTLEAVEGSRIILKEGIAGLATGNMVSWWPFLAMSLFCYGLVPRVLLFVYGGYRQRRFMVGFAPDTPAMRSILRRMETPYLSISGSKEAPATPRREMSAMVQDVSPDGASRKVAVLLPDECASRCSEQEVMAFLCSEGFAATTVQRFLVDYEHDQKILKVLAEQQPQGCLLFMESWMPPLQGFLSFLKELRNVLPPRAMIRVTLLGRPDDTTIFTPVNASVDQDVWQQKLDGLGDPFLEITTVDGEI